MKTLQDAIAKASQAMAGGPLEIALATVADLDNLRPLNLPEVPYIDERLRRMFVGLDPVNVEGADRMQYESYRDAVSARRQVISENERRLRSVLWCEQELRKHERPEAALVRTFSSEEWGVEEPAAHSCDAREAIVRMSVGPRRPRFVSMRPMRPQLKPVVPANDHRQGELHGNDLPIRRDPAR